MKTSTDDPSPNLIANEECPVIQPSDIESSDVKEPFCVDCGSGEELNDEGLCPECAYGTEAASFEAEAMEYARELCEITGELEVFDPRFEYAPSPEDYENGDREAYTENSIRTFNRHCRTNYDELLQPFPRCDPSAENTTFYSAIRSRIDFLLDQAEGTISETSEWFWSIDDDDYHYR